MEYLIREFRDEDLDKLVRLCAEHAAYEGHDYNPAGKDRLLKEALLRDKPWLHCWVVTVNEEVVGYTTFTFDFSTWDCNFFLHMDCLYLEEPFRGFGIGREIVRRLLNVAREQNCINIQWQTPSTNKSAIEFYSRLGAQMKTKQRFTIV